MATPYNVEVAKAWFAWDGTFPDDNAETGTEGVQPDEPPIEDESPLRHRRRDWDGQPQRHELGAE